MGNIVAVIAAIIDGDLTNPGVAVTCDAFLMKSGLARSIKVASSSGNCHYYVRLSDCFAERTGQKIVLQRHADFGMQHRQLPAGAA